MIAENILVVDVEVVAVDGQFDDEGLTQRFGQVHFAQ
jgi:hypothetical protein